jgi:hypothetical protein
MKLWVQYSISAFSGYNEVAQMDSKIIFAGISSIIGIACFVPYIRDIFRNTTKPHSYTWFIWTVLQAIAAAAMWSGGAGAAIASSVIGAVLCGFIFILSLKRGFKNVTRFDTVCLFGALIALTAYLLFHDALLSIIFATLTDAIGSLPTFRKAYREPQTETASTHLLSATSGAFAIAAIANFTLTTSLYLFAVTAMDAFCGLLVLVGKDRRRSKTAS